MIEWDTVIGRYRDSGTGRLVGRRSVRAAFEQSLANLTSLTDSLAQDLRAGRISLNQWRAEMREIIKFTQMAAAELAKGGRAQMTPADYGAVGQRVRVQYAYLDRWVAEIQSGGSLELSGRANQYLRAARSAYLENDRNNLALRGFDERRSVLHPAEHCAQCIDEASRGFQPIFATVEIGQRQCRHNDRCTWEYRNSRTGQTLAA